jgi:hypothetical protein
MSGGHSNLFIVEGLSFPLVAPEEGQSFDKLSPNGLG